MAPFGATPTPQAKITELEEDTDGLRRVVRGHENMGN